MKVQNSPENLDIEITLSMSNLLKEKKTNFWGLKEEVKSDHSIFFKAAQSSRLGRIEEMSLDFHKEEEALDSP